MDNQRANNRQELGGRLRTLRKKKRWTQEKLEEEANRHAAGGYTVSRVSISQYENGLVYPEGPTIALLARALQVTVEYLTGAPTVIMPIAEPELWEVIRKLNRQPSTVRKLAADMLDSLFELGAELAANLRQSGTPARDEDAAQGPAESAGQSVRTASASSLATTPEHTTEDLQRFLLDDDEADEPNGDSEQSQEGRRNGR